MKEDVMLIDGWQDADTAPDNTPVLVRGREIIAGGLGKTQGPALTGIGVFSVIGWFTRACNAAQKWTSVEVDAWMPLPGGGASFPSLDEIDSVNVRAIIAEQLARYWRKRAEVGPAPTDEAVARVIARALGHNDETGMHWDRYVMPARLLLHEFVIGDCPVHPKAPEQ